MPRKHTPTYITLNKQRILLPYPLNSVKQIGQHLSTLTTTIRYESENANYRIPRTTNVTNLVQCLFRIIAGQELFIE